MSGSQDAATVIIECPSCGRKNRAALASLVNTNCGQCHKPLVSTQPTTGTTSGQTTLRNCPDCHGKGEVREECSLCEGSGQEPCWCDRGLAGYGDGTPCPDCRGRQVLGPCGCCAAKGYNWAKCATCDGAGQITFAAFESLKTKREEIARHQAVEERNKIEAETRRRQEEQHPCEQEQRQREMEEQRRRAAAEAQRQVEERNKAEARTRRQKEIAAKMKIRNDNGKCMMCRGQFGLFEQKVKFDFPGWTPGVELVTWRVSGFVHERCNAINAFRD